MPYACGVLQRMRLGVRRSNGEQLVGLLPRVESDECEEAWFGFGFGVGVGVRVGVGVGLERRV